MFAVISMRQLLFVAAFSGVLVAQQSSPSQNSRPIESTPQAVAQQPPARGDDALAQMRDDLNKMESLNMNMSSEIEFLHDQNLQILLRTNSQMWTILIRDMQRQLQMQEQRRATAPSSPPK